MSERDELFQLMLGRTTTKAVERIIAAGYRKVADTKKRDRVIGRIHWDAKHTSPWMTFDHITAFRKWTTAVRKARPGVKTEYAYINLTWTADAMLRHLEWEAKEQSA